MSPPLNILDAQPSKSGLTVSPQRDSGPWLNDAFGYGDPFHCPRACKSTTNHWLPVTPVFQPRSDVPTGKLALPLSGSWRTRTSDLWSATSHREFAPHTQANADTRRTGFAPVSIPMKSLRSFVSHRLSAPVHAPRGNPELSNRRGIHPSRPFRLSAVHSLATKPDSTWPRSWAGGWRGGLPAALWVRRLVSRPSSRPVDLQRTEMRLLRLHLQD